MTPWVLDLEQIGPGMLDQVGGKAVNLGVLTSAGMPVPDGFCVTTEAYRRVVGTELDLTRSAAEIRQSVLGLEIPDELRAILIERYRRLGPQTPVAVRSSATAEDLAYASFAGQQDTFLNVIGPDALLEAVRRCWASLWTERAVSYRADQDIDNRTVSLAVVVQRMVDAAVAGVMFTANPVTGARHETVVDASPGLGEAVVSGAVNPDHFVLDRRRGAITERRLGDKRVLIAPRLGGGTEERRVDDDRGEACLTDTQVQALAALGARVQELYQAPQDTEWALDHCGDLWVTQTRPITTLYPRVGGEQTGSVAEPDGPRVLACLSLAQGLTRPITPMGMAAFRLLGSSVARAAGSPVAQPLAGPQAMHSVGQRVYLDVTGVLRHRLGRRLMTAAFSVMEARAAAVLHRLCERPEFALRPVSVPATIRPVVRVLVRTAAPLRMLTAVLSPRLAASGMRRLERRLRESLVVSTTLTAEQRLDLVERRLETDIFLLMPQAFGFVGAGFGLLALGRRLLGDLAGPGEVQQVQRSLPHNVTTEMDLELWQLAARIGDDSPSRDAFEQGSVAELVARFRTGSLPAQAQQGLSGFLTRYGHRAVAEIDLGMPRWAEDPSHLIGMILNYRRVSDPELAPDAQFARGAAAAEEMVRTLTRRARHRSRLRGRLVGWSLKRARELTGLRESPKFMLVLALAALREQLSEVGASLHARGRIGQPDDVFFLDFDDARRGLGGTDLHALVEQRRAAYAVELRRRHIPRLLLSDGTEPEAVGGAADRPDGALVGTPASTGLITGIARVVLDPIGAHLEPGEILVTPSTDPGWTPLFLTAGALVMEMGGSNSHGAVVAREYGIPAVVGVPGATRRIQTGQQVTVDGSAGLVFGPSLSNAP